MLEIRFEDHRKKLRQRVDFTSAVVYHTEYLTRTQQTAPENNMPTTNEVLFPEDRILAAERNRAAKKLAGCDDQMRRIDEEIARLEHEAGASADILAAARRKGCSPGPGDLPTILTGPAPGSVWVAHGQIAGTAGTSIDDFEHGTAVHPHDLRGGL